MLDETINRVRKLKNISFQKSQIEVVNEITKNKIILRTNSDYIAISISDIIRCQADEGYTNFYMKNGDHHIIAKPLKEYDELLPKQIFIRSHQSHLINKNFVESFYKEIITLKNSTIEIPIASRRKKEIINKLKNN